MNTVNTAKPAAAKNWVKPQLVKLGQIDDVAGNVLVNANGVGNNQKS